MYSDLLDVLGSRSSDDDGKHVAVSFKAGKMNMDLQENGKYLVTPDPRRGSIELVWANDSLKWEWMDRREKSVVDSIAVEEGGTFQRVDTGRPDDRVYLWETASKERSMYWMQTKSDEADDEHVAQVNQFLTNPKEANPNPADEPAAAGDGASLDPEALMQVMQGRPSSGSGGSQVDALSNILENLGMPQPSSNSSSDAAAAAAADTGAASSSAETTSAAAASSANRGGTLTLADLQGAMQGLATATPPGTPAAGPPLQELVTPGSVSALLDNEEVCNRLMELLPENQRTKEHLADNLKSPQVSQTLRSLTSALLPDDAGSMDGYHSVLANFQLDPQDGEAALRSGNPIQAFLDCVLASVQKEEGKKEESKEQDEPMEE